MMLQISHGENTFDCEFTQEGVLDKVWLLVSDSFSVDGIDVTLLVHSDFRRRAEEIYDSQVSTPDEDRAYESYRSREYEEDAV